MIAKPRIAKYTKRSWALAALCSTLISATPAMAGTVPAAAADDGVSFSGRLTAAAEVPATDSPANGTIHATLTGTPGRFVLTFDLAYTHLSSAPLDAHLHDAVSPPGLDPTEQEGPVVFDWAGSNSPSHEVWRFDSRPAPLTDALVDALYDGELYVNVHSDDFPDGEIRAQLVRDGQGNGNGGGTGGTGGTPGTPGGPGTKPPAAVPLPAPFALGAAGLAALAAVSRVRRPRGGGIG
jgi:hypothetical protein